MVRDALLLVHPDDGRSCGGGSRLEHLRDRSRCFQNVVGRALPAVGCEADESIRNPLRLEKGRACRKRNGPMRLKGRFDVGGGYASLSVRSHRLSRGLEIRHHLRACLRVKSAGRSLALSRLQETCGARTEVRGSIDDLSLYQGFTERRGGWPGHLLELSAVVPRPLDRDRGTTA
jgi:hypothetical protein